MRKVKLQIQVSINGKMATGDGSMDWMLLPWTSDLEKYVERITSTVDTIVMGRKLAEGFIPYWQNVANDHAHPEHEAGMLFSRMRQIVLSRGEGAFMIHGAEFQSDLPRLIKSLKSTEGGEIIVYGGCELVNSLLADSLADEIHLFINPSVVPGGVSAFDNIKALQRYGLLDVVVSACGIVVLIYKPLSYA